MTTPQERARLTYNAASDLYEHPANGYWARYGSETVKRLGLPPGGTVLDVASGTGASAIPAAETVGVGGKVVAVDLAEDLQAISRGKAQSLGLSNIEHRIGDMTALELPAQSFDAVVCVFGVFFAPDIRAFVDDLWRFVRPGGKLALTTWGPNLFEPMYSAFDRFLGQVRPDLVTNYRPWDQLTEPQELKDLMTLPEAEVSVEPVEGAQKLTEPGDWWRIVLGSGLRSAVIAMGDNNADAIRQETSDYIRSHGVQEIETNVIFGVARKAATEA